MKTVLILFGGVSSEHDVSLLSAASVITHLPKDKYKPVLLGITKEGRWLVYTGSGESLPGGKWLEDESLLTPAALSPDRIDGGLLLLTPEGVKPVKIDVVFPVLHGKNGEDGTVQGLLQLAGIPFAGCGLLASAMCMDKAVTNTIADKEGIAQAKWLGFGRHEYGKRSAELLEKAAAIGFPLFVKPANAGSSVGISKAKNLEALRVAVESAFIHDSKVVIEENIDGFEIECAVLGNREPVASVPGEVVPGNEFYDYEAKYISGTSRLHIPARLPKEKLEEVRRLARRIYAAMGCSGMARVDFFARKTDGAVLFNEINTIPGFTSISMYPKMFEASGLPYPQLLDRLLSLALE